MENTKHTKTRIYKQIFVSLFLLLPFNIFSQTNDFGTWYTGSIDKKLGNWNLESELELRLNDTLKSVQQWSGNLGLAYQIFKPIKIGINYEYISFNDVEYNDMQSRIRYSAYLLGKYDIKRFTLSLREKIQRTVKDERDRIKSDGTYDTYRINPKLAWRNRVQLEYNPHGLPIEYYLSCETYYTLNDSEGNYFYKLRYKLGADYRLDRRNSIGIYGLTNQEINIDSPINSYILGVSYNYKIY